MEVQSSLPNSIRTSAPTSIVSHTSLESSRVVGSQQTQLQDKQRQQGLSVSEQAVLEAIDKVNKTLDGIPQEFQYKVLDHNVVIRVINRDTKELIREIPPEKFIELVKKLQELTIGSFIDEKR